jgi:uncharacterized protein
MRLWGATFWRSRCSRIATPKGRICAWISRAAALASASLLLACLSTAVRAQSPDQLQREPPLREQLQIDQLESDEPQKELPKKPAQQPLQQAWTTQRIASRLKHNQDTLLVAASRPGATYLGMVEDLAAAIGADGSVRILPIAADGGLANLQDLLLLRGVDLAIVPANVLAHAKATNAAGGGLPQRLAYVAPLYGEEVHIIVGPDIASAADLQGKKVATPRGDGTVQFAAKDVFQRLGVTFEEVPMEAADAVREVRAGTVAAALLVAGKPVPLVSTLPKDGRLRLLSLSFPKPPGEAEGYSPAVLLPDDYPALIPPGTIVETVAVGTLLMTSRETDEVVRRMARHAPAVLDAIARLAVSQRHPKWKDVNLGAALPGWPRVPAVETWLARASAQRREALQSQFTEFLRAEKHVSSADLSDPEKKKLFDEFQAWARKSVTSERAGK